MVEKKNGKVSDSMKRALCKIVDMRFNLKRDKVKADNEDIMSAALEFTKKKLGYAVINKKIQQLIVKRGMVEDEIKMLRDNLSEIGFDQHGGLRTLYDHKTGQYLPVASVANKMITGKITESTADLEKERIDYIYKLMLAENAEEAKGIMAEIMQEVKV